MIDRYCEGPQLFKTDVIDGVSHTVHIRPIEKEDKKVFNLELVIKGSHVEKQFPTFSEACLWYEKEIGRVEASE